MKTCSKCQIEQPFENFSFRADSQKYRNECKDCQSQYNKKYGQEHKDDKKEYNDSYYEQNRDLILEQKKEYQQLSKDAIKESKARRYQRDKEKIKAKVAIYQQEKKEVIRERNRIYVQENKEKVRTWQRQRDKNRRKNDPIYKARRNISRLITYGLKEQGSTKNGESCLPHLPFSWDEYKNHMEQQFKLPGNEWMTWENQGRYVIKEWDDNDTNTWKWQLDHIIPQSQLPYTSMEDENFKKCWVLSNLRPYSAKQNIIDGSRNR